MKTALTTKQSELLEFIRSFADRKGHAPSYEQMRQAVGLQSRSGIHRLILGLDERGVIRRLPNRARAIEVVDQSNLPRDLEQRISTYCRSVGITRPTFDQRAAECLLRGGR